MKVFFLVLARDEKHVAEKVEELERLGVHYLIVCGQRLSGPNIIYREPKGKYDAINFGFNFVPIDTDAVVLNDVDTRIRNFQEALKYLQSTNIALVFAKVVVKEGPQASFYSMLDRIRHIVQVAASGELMLVKYSAMKMIIPLKPCKAEDTYILFKIMELGLKSAFCEECYVETERTVSAEKEEAYKRKTVAGIYQALAYTSPPNAVKIFYTVLPIISPLLLITGKKGYFWMKGILNGLVDYIRGDRTGFWIPTYMS